jgi:hypothetical protein
MGTSIKIGSDLWRLGLISLPENTGEGKIGLRKPELLLQDQQQVLCALLCDAQQFGIIESYVQEEDSLLMRLRSVQLNSYIDVEKWGVSAVYFSAIIHSSKCPIRAQVWMLDLHDQLVYLLITGVVTSLWSLCNRMYSVWRSTDPNWSSSPFILTGNSGRERLL